MIKLLIPPNIKQKLIRSCRRAGQNECGGILFAQDIGNNTFQIEEITADPRKGGRFATFIRNLNWTLKRLNQYFHKYKNDFKKYNYLGEWHSHPQFQLSPSGQDNQSILDIVTDPSVGANFVVLMIVKMENDELKAKAWSYFPNRQRNDCQII